MLQDLLGSFVPVLRKTAPDAMKPVARAFARVAWPAFGVIVATGLWNLVEVNVSDTSTEYQVTVFVKVLLSMVAAGAVAVHQIGRSKAALAIGGALGALASVAALFVGVLMRTGTY